MNRLVKFALALMGCFSLPATTAIAAQEFTVPLQLTSDCLLEAFAEGYDGQIIETLPVYSPLSDILRRAYLTPDILSHYSVTTPLDVENTLGIGGAVAIRPWDQGQAIEYAGAMDLTDVVVRSQLEDIGQFTTEESWVAADYQQLILPSRLGCTDTAGLPPQSFGRDGGTHMTNGATPTSGGAAFAQSALAAAFGGVSMAGNSGQEATCAILSPMTADTCFLPSVGLIYVVAGDVGCTGTIVGPYHVLTAAHCVCVEGSNKFAHISSILVGTHGGMSSAWYSQVDEHNPAVRLGDLSDTSGKSSGLVEVADVRVFGDVCRSGPAEDDLAIVTVVAPFPKQLQAVLITPPPVNAKVNLAGFGIDNAAPNGVGERNLKRYLSGFSRGVADNVLKISAEYGDSCQGDSGSGALIRSADGTLGVFGVLSRGVNNCSNLVAASYVDISNERYKEFLAPLTVTKFEDFYTEPDDADLCIGLLCPEGLGARLAGL